MYPDFGAIHSDGSSGSGPDSLNRFFGQTTVPKDLSLGKSSPGIQTVSAHKTPLIRTTPRSQRLHRHGFPP
jgi:hypothetical protein